jgi:hypothetical protein
MGAWYRGRIYLLLWLLPSSNDNSFKSTIFYIIIYFSLRLLLTRHPRQNVVIRHYSRFSRRIHHSNKIISLKRALYLFRCDICFNLP